MTAENPRAPERKVRTFRFFDNRHRTVPSGHDGTEGRHDPVEALAPAGPKRPPHRHARYTEHVYALETGTEGMRVVPTRTNWSRRSPVRTAKRGEVETRHRDAGKKTGYVSRSNARRSAPVDQISFEGLGRGGKR